MKAKDICYLVLAVVLLTMNVNADDLVDVDPGHPLYTVERAVEGLEYSLAFSTEAKISVALKHVEKRMREIQVVNDSQIQQNLERDLEDGVDTVDDLGSQISSLAKKREFGLLLEKAFNHHVQVLEEKGMSERIRNARRIKLKAREVFENNPPSSDLGDLDVLIDRNCHIPQEYIQDVDEVVRVELYDGDAVVWFRTFRVSGGDVDCDYSGSPTVTVSASKSLALDYLEDAPVSADRVASDLAQDRIKVTPPEKMFLLTRFL